MDGTPFGRYRLIELLGRGGMGEVWQAHDTETDRVVALKVLPAHLSADEEFQRRFRREAHAAARLNSPHVIPIHHYGEIDGRLYLDMRLIEGRDLASLLASGPLDPTRAVNIVGQVAKALHSAHKVGLLHRDIKPSNILLDDDDFAYLIDFGIARTMDETRMTKTGNAIGTFHYIAPERLAIGVDEDARADVYSLACVLYECLTGSPPFPGGTMPQLVAAHLNAPPPRPSIDRPEVPGPVDDVIARGMAKDPDQRYATTVELANAAREAITEPIPRPAATARVQPPTEHAVRPDTPPAQSYDDWMQTVSSPSAGRRGAEPLASNGASFGSPAAQDERTVSASPQPESMPSVPTRASGIRRGAWALITLGSILLVVPFVFPLGAFLMLIGLVVLVLGLVMMAAGRAKRASGEHPPHRRLKRPIIVAVVLAIAAAGVTGYLFWSRPTGHTVLPFTGLRYPLGLAVDTSGNVYVVDGYNNRVLKLPVGSDAQVVLPFTGLNNPEAVAVDNAGDIYVTDPNNKRLLKLAAKSGIAVELPFPGLNGAGVAVDAAGDIYVTRRNEVVKLAAGSSAQTVLAFTGLNSPWGVTVDNGGNVYVADSADDRVVELLAGASGQRVLPFTGLKSPRGLAVSSAGDVYVADFGNNRVVKLAASSATQTVVPYQRRIGFENSINEPSSVAVDASGNLYIEDWGNHRVLKIPAG